MPLDKNLTGEQIQQVLDLFLYKALEPIVLNTDAFDLQVSYILALVSANRKRKPSSLPRERVIELLCQYLASDDRPTKYRLLREARLERSFLHVFASRFLKQYEEYVTIYNNFMSATNSGARLLLKGELDASANNAGCSDRQGLYRILTLANSYLQKFYSSRSLVLDHYLKLSSRQAKMFTSASNGTIDFQDVRQSILKSILVAIDKYDSNKGALTSYINWWVLNAQTCGTSEHEYGIAYTVPQSQRKKIALHDTGYLNYSVSLDDVVGEEGRDLHSIIGDGANVQAELERRDSARVIQELAKCVDARGCARLVLDIDETFSADEMRIMRDHSADEGCT